MTCKNCNCKDCISSRDILKQRMQDSISYSRNSYIQDPLPIIDWSSYVQSRRFTKDEIYKAIKKGIDSIGSKPFSGSESHKVSEPMAANLEIKFDSNSRTDGVDLKLSAIKNRDAKPIMFNPCAEIPLAPYKEFDERIVEAIKVAKQIQANNNEAAKKLQGGMPAGRMMSLTGSNKKIPTYEELLESTYSVRQITTSKLPNQLPNNVSVTSTPVYEIGRDTPVDYIPTRTNKSPSQMIGFTPNYVVNGADPKAAIKRSATNSIY